MVLVGKPMDGAQATSRTQSLCASSFCSSFHWLSSSLEHSGVVRRVAAGRADLLRWQALGVQLSDSWFVQLTERKHSPLLHKQLCGSN